MSEQEVLVEIRGHVGWIQLHRPKALNALHMGLIKQLANHLEELDGNDDIRCIVLKGDSKAFAAGADIDEMAESSPIDLIRKEFFGDWQRIRNIKKPVIAAVSGYALGGGCELAMCCDMIIASENARFGQPEIKLGVIPGAGGTQRLTRAVGKVKAMEMVLTGSTISADEALKAGLINRVVPVDQLEEETSKLADKIASHPPIAVHLAKQAILKALDVPLEYGLQFEQHLFYLLFASEDQREGMKAFIEKRKPDFSGR
ncbi:enoyl-CoA hydratase-related protein [Hazenella coriacea]|uniref:Probable enoyl-CoA hydratase echA8 n=1 Tax=Hazenella coriacea TaxID=1179467 RepID=A0A4R3L9S2_9BACL|nr:enoyl-CoA hydratase-related protein [Hazenella coriacea]TCS95978.1 enoyl-CoA hydratase [Hazenella coriacea]